MSDPRDPVQRFLPFPDGQAPENWPTVFVDADDYDSLMEERDKARAALQDIKLERSHGATANSEYIDRRISEGLGEGRA